MCVCVHMYIHVIHMCVLFLLEGEDKMSHYCIIVLGVSTLGTSVLLWWMYKHFSGKDKYNVEGTYICVHMLRVYYMCVCANMYMYVCMYVPIWIFLVVTTLFHTRLLQVENIMDLQHFLPCCNLVNWL